MPLQFLTQLFGNRNERLLKQYRAVVAKVNALEPEFERLDDAALAAKTEEFRRRYQDGVSLDHLLPEAFATVREAAKRVHGMRLITPKWSDRRAAARAVASVGSARRNTVPDRKFGT